MIFDHAGSGWSSNTKTTRTIENMVDELSILIDTIVPNKPIVLLCHSLGSLEAIGYAQMNPKKVEGIIFLDSGSPEFYSTDSELFAKIINRGSAFIRTIGMNRLLGELGVLSPLYGENIRNQSIPEGRDIKLLCKYLSVLCLVEHIDKVGVFKKIFSRVFAHLIKSLQKNKKHAFSTMFLFTLIDVYLESTWTKIAQSPLVKEFVDNFSQK